MAIVRAKTQAGIVVGYPTDYQASTRFCGIPYAKPPVGNLRWRSPQPVDLWDGEFHAFSYGPIPMQERPVKGEFYADEFYPINWPMSEDCLYLNVVTPAKTSDDQLLLSSGYMGEVSRKATVRNSRPTERPLPNEV